MKKIISITVFLLVAVMAFAVDYIDVVEKTDGSILKGVIIENKINEFVKIELAGGSVFRIEYEDIETIKKEKVLSDNSGANTGNSIVINNAANATSESSSESSSSSSKDDIKGYTLSQLNLMFNDIKYNELKKINFNEGKMRDTEYDFRSATFTINKMDSVVSYSVLNWLLPGVGSFAQGDYGMGGATLAVNIIGTIVIYSSYLSYLNYMSEYDSYDYAYDYDDAYDKAQEAAGIMTASAVVMSLWNLGQIFAPSVFKSKYNKLLGDKLKTR